MLSGNGVVFVPANNAKPKQRSLPPSLSGGAPPKIKKASSYKKPPSSSSSSNSNSSSSFNNQSTIKSYQAPAKTLGSIISSNDKLKSKQQDLPPTIFPELVSFDLNQCDTYQSLLSKLSEEQMNVLKCVMEGHSIFITGVAGTGKSFLLESIIQTLSNVQQKKVVVTASTGISAVNIGGSTIHSFAGIRVLDNGKVDSKTAWRNEKEWRSVDVLIIDEISMIDGQYFDQLESIATEIRCFFEIAASRAPKEVIMKQLPAFGGIQVILCGDFLQLPPVSKSFKNEHGETIYQKKEMCFKANSWERTIKYTFELTNVFRQEEKEWISILNSIRCCQNNNNIVQTLRGLENNKFDGIEKATVIHTLNKNVDSVNDTELLKLSPPQYTYKDQTFFSYGDYDPNVDHPTVKEYIRSAILSNFNSSNASQEINLRVGAQVMIIKNDFTNQLVNGTRGEIIGFVKQTPSDLQSSNKNIKQYAEQYITENGELFPKVVFTREENGKETKIIKIVHPTIFETDGPKKSKGVRIQIPLKLAYAMTVHKTQGLTLQKCVIDLSTVFSPGQIYVALSRAKTMKYLKVTNFNAYHLTKHINREAIDFYNKLKKQDKYLAQDTDSKELFIENLLKKNQESFEKRRKIFEETIKNLDLSDFNANSGSGTKKRKNDSGSSSSGSGTSYHSQIMKKSKLNPKSTSSSSGSTTKSSGVSKSGKVYCVCIGRRPGIFNTWDECKMQVDQFQGARFKSFTSRLDAEKYMIENGCEDFINNR